MYMKVMARSSQKNEQRQKQLAKWERTKDLHSQALDTLKDAVIMTNGFRVMTREMMAGKKAVRRGKRIKLSVWFELEVEEWISIYSQRDECSGYPSLALRLETLDLLGLLLLAIPRTNRFFGKATQDDKLHDIVCSDDYPCNRLYFGEDFCWVQVVKAFCVTIWELISLASLHPAADFERLLASLNEETFEEWSRDKLAKGYSDSSLNSQRMYMLLPLVRSLATSQCCYL